MSVFIQIILVEHIWRFLWVFLGGGGGGASCSHKVSVTCFYANFPVLCVSPVPLPAEFVKVRAIFFLLWAFSSLPPFLYSVNALQVFLHCSLFYSSHVVVRFFDNSSVLCRVFFISISLGYAGRVTSGDVEIECMGLLSFFCSVMLAKSVPSPVTKWY